MLHEYLHVNLERNRYKLLKQICIVKYHEKKKRKLVLYRMYVFS